MVDPLTLALVQGGSSVLSAAVKPAGAAPSSASGYSSSSFDFGNWTVGTGQAQVAGGTTGLSFPPWAMLAAVVVVALAWKTKK